MSIRVGEIPRMGHCIAPAHKLADQARKHKLPVGSAACGVALAGHQPIARIADLAYGRASGAGRYASAPSRARCRCSTIALTVLSGRCCGSARAYAFSLPIISSTGMGPVSPGGWSST